LKNHEYIDPDEPGLFTSRGCRRRRCEERSDVAISCFWRGTMRSPRSLRSLVMTWCSTANAL